MVAVGCSESLVIKISTSIGTETQMLLNVSALDEVSKALVQENKVVNREVTNDGCAFVCANVGCFKEQCCSI